MQKRIRDIPVGMLAITISLFPLSIVIRQFDNVEQAFVFFLNMCSLYLFYRLFRFGAFLVHGIILDDKTK